MGQAIEFSRAAIALSAAGATQDDAAYRTYERLERIVLDHIPRSAEEAARMLDVIIPDVQAGGRSDGRDVKALRNIRSMLLSAQEPSSSMGSGSAL